MPDVASLLEAALRYQHAGNLPEAERLCLEVLQAHPRHAGALHLLGLVYLRAGHTDLAAEHISLALRLKPDYAEAHNSLGAVFRQQQRLPGAIDCYRQALRHRPDYAEAHYNLGNALRDQGQTAEAEACYREALRLKPDYAEAHNNLGTTLKEQGKLAEAEASYREAVRLRPGFAEAHYNLGAALAGLGRPAEAEASLRQATRLRADFAEAHADLGAALGMQGRLAEAEASLRQAVLLRPDHAEGYYNLGVALLKQGKAEEAAASFRQAVRLNPDHAQAHNNLGSALADLRRLEEAEASYRRALQIDPDRAEIHNNLGVDLVAQGRSEEAEASYRRALQIDPGLAEAHVNLGNALKMQGRPEEAEACYREALRLDPNHAEAHLSVGLSLLQQGELERGWAEYEWRWRCRDTTPPTYRQPAWDGSPLDGRTILLYAEQGLGDTLLFARYAPPVHDRGGRVLLAVQPPLRRLLATLRGVAAVLPQGGPLPDFDVHTPLLSVPRLLGTTLGTIPAAVPYLAAEPERVEHWRPELEAHPGLRVGIAWQGSPGYRADRDRSVPLKHFAPLARVPGVQLISLQKGPGREQIAQADFPVLDLGDRLDLEPGGAFLDTAAVIRNLDLVIAPDSAVTHLAGALAAPAWVALSYAADWRWFLGRDDSPWYPTLRLFRQDRRGDWSIVLERMATALRAGAGLQRSKLSGAKDDGQKTGGAGRATQFPAGP